MSACAVCGCSESRDELVREVFQIGSNYVLVNCIPANVCSRCGEQSFSREVTEKVRQMLHEQATPTKSITVNVFEFV